MKSIKYILTMGLGFLAASVTNAARYDPPESGGPATVMVNQSDVLVAPTATELINANPEFSDFFKVKGWQVNIDTTPSINPIDGYQTQLKTLQINTPYIDVSDILLKKLNKGTVYYNGGSAAASGVVQTFPFSVCLTTRYLATATPSQNSPQIINIGGLGGYVQTTGIAIWASYTASRSLNVRGRFVGGGTLYETSIANFFDGKEKSCVFVATTTGLKIYINGNLVSTLTWTAADFSTARAITIGGNANEQTISRVKVFNFDMSAADASYTIADYTAGIDEPPIAHTPRNTISNTDPDMGASTDGGWATTGTHGVWNAGVGTYRMSYIANADLTGDAEAAGLGIAYAVDLSTKTNPGGYGIVAGLNNTQISLLPFAGKTIKIRASFYAKKVSEDNNSLQIRTNGATSNNSIQVYAWAASNFNTSTWTKIDEVFEFTVPDSTSIARPIAIFATGGDTASYRVANFHFEVLGVSLLSLSDYTLNGQILDASGNGNNATVSGRVAGTHDAEIGALYKAFTGNDATVSSSGYVPTVQSFQEALRAALNSDGTAYTNTYQYEDDTVVLTEWTDGEFKVLDENGDLIYWVSTQWGAQMGGDYTTNDATDLNAKIFYTCPENEVNGAGKGREWIEYVHNDVSARTIYEHAQGITGSATPTIGGIIIQPNFSGTTVGGTSIQSIFGKNVLDAPSGYQFIYLKASPTNLEKTKTAYPIWRTIRPIPVQGGN